MPIPSAIRIPFYAKAVLDQLESLGYQAYTVGGCVRDSLMSRVPADWDVCTDATPEQMLAVFSQWRVFKTGLKHGTITVRSKGHNVEVTTFRTDGSYSDNRHPDAVSFVTRVEDDLARRDFTINAMAYSPERGLVDAFGGQEDLDGGLIRCVGEPDVRFNEDGLRILRALRFAARFGFDIEDETANSIRRNHLLLNNISAERIFKELQGILVAPGAAKVLLSFPEVMDCILPEAAAGHDATVWESKLRRMGKVPSDHFPLRLALLLHGADDQNVRSALNRLRSDNKTADYVCTVLKELPKTLPPDRAGMRRLIGRIGEKLVRDILGVKEMMGETEQVHCASLLLAETLATPPAYCIGDLAVGGQDLMRLGITPGPMLGHILRRLLNEVQGETLANEKTSLLSRARELHMCPKKIYHINH